MENVFLHLLNMSLTAGILVVAVLLLRLVFHKAPRWIHVLLWALVAVRLLCPFTIESSLSLMPDTPAVSVPAPAPAPDTPPVENSVPDTPVVDSPTVIPPVTDTPVVIPPATDTPVVTPPVSDTPVVTPTPDASVSTATTEASVDPWQIALTVATYVWLAGIVLLAAYAVFTTLRLRRQVGEAAHLSDNLWQCDHLRSPFILGVFRPRIYLPSDLNATARASVVAHEQAHLHRRDHWWKPLGFVLLTVYWFNPLMWVAYILLCRDIEAACDERVVRDMPAADRKAYSEALLACSAPRRLVSACPLAFGETSVKSRVKSVLSYKKPTIWIIVAALLVSTVAGVCLLTDPKSDDTDKPAVTDTDDDPDAEPQYAVFTHVQQPYAQVTLEIGGNRCTYTNSALSSAMLLEGTYEMGEDTVTMTFPDDAMTLLFDGDLTGLTLRIGNGGSLMSYEQMSFGDYTLKDGAVFERKDKIHAVSFTAPVTFAAGQVQMTEEQRNTLYNQYQYRTGNYSDKDRPIIPITSRAELDAFLDDYIIESKAELVSGYDDAFFADKMLLAVYHRDGSGSLEPKIAAVMYNGTELVTVQVDVYEPSYVDFSNGQWFMLAEVPLAEIKGATAYRAVIRYRIPIDNYWATYSHPVYADSDENDAFIGYYSLSEDDRRPLLSLVEGLEWYAPEGGVYTDFAAIASFAFADEKQYYLSHDQTRLYDGEHFANLTAEQSELLVGYLRAGNPGVDAATASVTGTVTEWSKEGHYLMLDVTDGDSKLGSQVKVYTGILEAGSGPAVGYAATIYYDGWSDGNIIYAIDRKWQDADLLGGPTINPTDESLYDALLQSVVDYHLWHILSAEEPDCSSMIGQHTDLSELGVQLVDLDQDGQRELLISAMDWPDGVTPFVYDVYTIRDGKLVHLLSSAERSRYYLREDGYVERQWSNGAANSGTDFYRLADGELTRLMRIAYDADYAVKCGLAPDLSSVTEDVAWFHTGYDSEGNELGFGHVTKQKAQNIIADLAADHPLLEVNFLRLETGVAGGPEDDDPPTTGTTTTTKPTTGSTTGTSATTKPTTPTTKPTTPELPTTAPVGLTYIIRTGTSSNEEYEALYGTPIRRFDTRAELESFLIEFQTMGRGWKRWEISDFDQFDNAFFAESSLLVTGWLTSSGMHTPQVAVYTYSEDGTVLSVGVDELHPSFVTDDMGEWLLFSGIKKADLQGVTEVTAYERKVIPTNCYLAAFTAPTKQPETGVEKWRKFIPSDEGWEWSYWWEQMEEANRWVSASSMGDTYRYIGVFQDNRHIHYVSSDYTVLLRDDGKMIQLNQREINLLQWMFILCSEDDPNIYFVQSSHPGMDPGYLYTPRVINSPELRAIAERQSWLKNTSTHTFEAQFVVDGKMYYVDWDKEQILYYQEDVGSKVLFMTKEEKAYLATLICDPTLTCNAQIKGAVVSSAPQLDYLIMRTEAGKEIQVSLLYWEDKAFDIGTQITVGYDGYTKEGEYPIIYARSIVKQTWVNF